LAKGSATAGLGLGLVREKFLPPIPVARGSAWMVAFLVAVSERKQEIYQQE
jgi:hypothetical protein